MIHIVIYFSASIIATIWALFLPSVDQSIYFHRASVSDEERSRQIDLLSVTIGHQPQSSLPQESLHNDENNTKNSTKCRCCSGFGSSLFLKLKTAYALLWKHFVQAYTNYRVIKWSVWWALSTCGYLQIISYTQLLWKTAVQPGDRIYNGAVDFSYSILGKELCSESNIAT